MEILSLTVFQFNLLKFSSKSVEQHILESYFVDVNEEYVPLAIQYLKIQLQNLPNFDARLTYRKETGNQEKNLKRKKESVEYDQDTQRGTILHLCCLPWMSL